LKITKVEATILRLPPSERTEVLVGHEDDLIVRIETDEGIEGIGEIDGPPLMLYPVIKSVHGGTWNAGLEEALIGEDPLDIERLWEKLYAVSGFGGRRGLATYAMSGLDIALWDIAGKYYGQPIYKLLTQGRPPSGVVTPYASLWPMAGSEEELVQRLRRDVKKPGYKGAKFWIANYINPNEPSYEKAQNYVKAAREELGDDTAIMVDASNRMETKGAMRFARSIEPYNVFFFEAALQPDNYDGYAKLASSTSINIAAGEEQTTRYMFIDLMDKGKVDIVQPDAVLCGGITECKRVADLARDRGILCIPHASNSDVSLIANMHVAAAIRNAPFSEKFVARSALTKDLVNEKFELDSKGDITLPDKPGLGLTLNEKIVEKYRYDGPISRY
jgi:L-rhamnonate dehydratase